MSIEFSEPLEIRSSKAAASFSRNDLELRAVTTLLARLNILDPQEKHDGGPHDDMKFLERFQLRHLTAISSLLARDGEIVACIPKSTSRGVEIFITPTVSASGPSASDNLAYPKLAIKLISDEKEAAAIKIKGIDDVCNFVLDNWSLGFEEHARTVAKLLNDCIQVGAKSSGAWKTLSYYCVIQSSPKLAKYCDSKYLDILLNALQDRRLEPETAMEIPTMTSSDRSYMKVMLRKLRFVGLPGYSVLEGLLADSPATSHQVTPVMLIAISGVFGRLMNEICKAACKVASMRGAPSQPSATAFNKSANKLWHLLRYLEYWTSYSNFFRWFISGYLEKDIERLSAGKNPGSRELDREIINLELPGRIMEKGNSAVSRPVLELRRWLRLVVSNIHNACMFFKSHSLGMTIGTNQKIVFKLLQVPPPSTNIRDWRDVVRDLFPANEERKRVVELLDGKGFTADWKFTGGVHCTAVLWCLHTLDSSDVVSTAIIPQSIISEFCDSYNLIAPSRQRCPVCAAIFQQVSSETTIPIIGTHSTIEPCAFPQGLHEEARSKVLNHFKGVLTTTLRDLVDDASIPIPEESPEGVAKPTLVAVGIDAPTPDLREVGKDAPTSSLQGAGKDVDSTEAKVVKDG